MMKIFRNSAILMAMVALLSVSGAGAAGPDAANQYATGVFDKIKANWQHQAVTNKLSRSVLTFTLNPDGTLAAAHLDNVSGDGKSGEETLDFLKKNAPFGQFPADLQGAPMEFQFLLSPYSLKMLSYQKMEEAQPQTASPIAMAPGSVFLAKVDPAAKVTGANPVKQALQMPDMSMDRYVADVQDRIRQKWGLPQDYVFKQTVATIMIDRDGSLMSAMLKQPSGDKAVDKAALKAIQDAAPFAAVPKTAPSLPVQIEYIFDPVMSPATSD